MILDKWKAIFIHIPKTAGGSMETSLLKKYFKTEKMPAASPLRRRLLAHNKKWTQHYPIQKTIDTHGVKKSEYFKFCFVRNPWSRAVSEFFYIKKQKGCHCSLENIPKTFKDWCKKDMPCSWEWHTDPQVNFIIDKKGETIMDFIGRFENLQEDFNLVCNAINIPTSNLPIHNSTNHKHYTEYYDDETQAIVTEKYAKDIDYFGYKFGE